MRILSLLPLLPLTSLLAEPIFKTGSTWQTVSDEHQFAEGMAFDQEGHFYFTDVPRSQLFKIGKGASEKVLLDGETGRTNGIAFGPDGRLYGCAGGDKKIYAWDPQTWKKTAVAEGTASNDIAVRKDGTIFYTDPRTQSVWRVEAPTRKLERAAQLDWNPNGITLSLDHKTLFVAEFKKDTIHAFAIGEDNTLGEDKTGFLLEVPQGEEGRLDGMMIHHDGRVLSGTATGIQIGPRFDGSAKKSAVIVIPIPNDLPRCNYVRMSPDGRWLYAAHAKAILRRELDPSFAKKKPDPK